MDSYQEKLERRASKQNCGKGASIRRQIARDLKFGRVIMEFRDGHAVLVPVVDLTRPQIKRTKRKIELD